MLTINVRNHSTVISDQDIKDIVDALQIQDTRDLIPIWHLEECIYRFVEKDILEIQGIQELVILDNSDQAGALGYHDLTTNGDPLGKVFAKEDLQYNSKISVTVSHEACEMRVDPSINLCAAVEGNNNHTMFYALEVGDPCEDDPYGYPVITPKQKSIIMSDFVTPRWFEDNYDQRSKYDFMGYIKKPLELLPNGYVGVNDGTGWTQNTAQTVNPLLRKKVFEPGMGHRRERRVRGLSAFQRSIRPAMKNLQEP